jgi:hypothetical protein
MEAAMAAFATAVALGDVDDRVSRVVRGYVKRSLERSRKLLGGSLPAA